MSITAARLKRKCSGDVADEPADKRLFSNLTNFNSIVVSKSKETVVKSQNNSKKDVGLVKPLPAPVPVTHFVEEPTEMISQVTTNDIQKQIPRNSVDMMRSIKTVLELNFKDVRNRLSLSYIPPCLYDLNNCRAEHSSAVELASNETVSLAKNYFVEKRQLQFISHVRNLCGRNEFPGIEVVRLILEMIILETRSADSTIPTNQVVMELYSLFMTCITTFPPCIKDMHDSYFRLVQSPFKVKGISADSPGFNALIDLLETEMYSSQELDAVLRKPSDPDKLNNFFFWDAQTEENSSFANFSRRDKLDRIFLVLDLIVTLLGNDLSIFIIKNSSRLQSAINNKDHRPLICAILWQKNYESIIVVNAVIKKIISIYVNMVGLRYPKEKIKIMSSLLNLIAQVSNISEYPDKSFEYPTYKNVTLDLLCAIQKAIEDSIFYNIDFYIRATESIRSPLIQLLLVNQALQKITNDRLPISLKVPFDCIRLKKFLIFKDEPSISIEKNKIKYPSYDSKKENLVQRSEVTQREYLKFLLIYTTALNNYYCVKAGIDKMRGQSKPIAESTDNETLQGAPRQIDLSFKKLFHIKLSKEICEFYRNEMKHLMLLSKLIKTVNQKYGEKFSEWSNGISQIEVS